MKKYEANLSKAESLYLESEYEKAGQIYRKLMDLARQILQFAVGWEFVI